MIERLNGRAAVGLAAAGLLLVVLVGWLGFVSPQRSKAAELQVKIDEAETQLAVTQALIQGPLLRQSTAQLATLRLAIPDEVRMSGILRQLSEASARSRVRVLGITPQPVVVNAGGPDIVAMSVAIEGRYFGIREFLRLLRARRDSGPRQGERHRTAVCDRLDSVHGGECRDRRRPDPGDVERHRVCLQRHRFHAGRRRPRRLGG